MSNDIQRKTDIIRSESVPIKNKQRNGTIDLLRLYFTIAVVMAHMISLFFQENSMRMPLRNGHISVEFFFVVSGYLMSTACNKKRSESGQSTGYATYLFFRHKMQTLYPIWLLACFISLLLYFTNHRFSIAEIWKTLPAFLMISNLGFLDAHNIPWGWYIPTMLLAMAILFPLGYRFRSTFFYWMAPLIALFTAVFLFQRNGKIMALQEEWLILIYPQTIRALCGLCLGCCAWTIKERLNTWDGKLTIMGTTILSLFELALWSVPIFGLLGIVSAYMHLPFMLCFMAGTALAFSNLTWQGKIIRGSFFSWIGRISYAIYLAQFLSKELTPRWVDPTNTGLFIATYLVVSVGGGIALYYLAKTLSFLCKNIMIRAKSLLVRNI